MSEFNSPDYGYTQANYGGQPEYAGFWLRFVAYIIDAILINIVTSIINSALGVNMFAALISNPDASPEESMEMLTTMLPSVMQASAIAMVITFLYFAYMESSKHQGTLGKIALGLKVTDMNGQKIDFVKALTRNIAKILSAILLLIGYIMAGFTEKKQALHDVLTGCLVVKK